MSAGGLFNDRTPGRGLNFGRSKRVSADRLQEWRDSNRRRAKRRALNPDPVEDELGRAEEAVS